MSSDAPFSAGSSRNVPGGAFRAWFATGLYVALLYASPALLNRLYRQAFSALGGREPTSWWVNLIFAVLGGCLLLLVVRLPPPRLGRLLSMVLIALALSGLLLSLEIPAKRLHFLQYAPVTLLMFRAVGFQSRDRYRYMWTLAAVALVGLGDELVQSQVPNRYFGWLDVGINAVASVLTLAFVGFVLPGRAAEWQKKPAP